MLEKAVLAIVSVVLVMTLCPVVALADGKSGNFGASAAEAGSPLAVAVQASKSRKVPLSTCTVKLAKKSYRYTGKNVKAKVTVKYRGKKLVRGKNYRVVYKNSAGVMVAAPKDPGTYKVVVKGGGGFKGKAVKTLKVAQPRYIQAEGFRFIKPAYWHGRVSKRVSVNDGAYNTGKLLTIRDTSGSAGAIFIHYCPTASYRPMSGWGDVSLLGVRQGATYTVAVYWGMGAGQDGFSASRGIETITGGAISEGDHTTFARVRSAATRYLRAKVLNRLEVF